MAWTSPLTWAVSQLVTAAQLNTHLRDNLNETAPAKVTTAGDIVYATGANAIARLAIGSANQALRVVSGLPTWQSLFGVAPTTAAYANSEGANNAAARADHVHAVSLTTASATLGSDTALTVGSDQDLVSVSLVAGTWLVSAWVSVLNAVGAAVNFDFFIWDGTTYHASGNRFNTNNVTDAASLPAVPITLGSTTTVRLGIRPSATCTAKATSQVGGRANATAIRAVRIA